MGISNVSEGWGGDRPRSQSGQGPSGAHTGANQTDAMPDVGPKKNPKHIDYPQTDLPKGQPKKPKTALPAETVEMYVILSIPQDEYNAWVGSLPKFVKIKESDILDNDARDRLGF